MLLLAANAQADPDKTPLAQEMSGISRDFRSLRKVVADPAQKAAALQLVKDMEGHAAKAKDLSPALAQKIDPAKKDQFLADYRKQLDELIADFQKLEADVTAGNSAESTAMLDKLQADKRTGHKKFNAEDNKPPGAPAGS